MWCRLSLCFTAKSLRPIIVASWPVVPDTARVQGPSSRAMHCPFCPAKETRVIDSRLVGEGAQVRRRRACGECGARFTTYENVELNLPRVIKRDASREPFDDDKLRAGMLRALEQRPVPSDDFEAALSGIMRELSTGGEREVSSRVIGEHAMSALRALDQVAFVRFASVYRRFQDVGDFREEIERLEAEPTPEAKRSQLPLLPDE